jgi:hypothetical protein
MQPRKGLHFYLHFICISLKVISVIKHTIETLS